jgi:hypothetical protein
MGERIDAETATAIEVVTVAGREDALIVALCREAGDTEPADELVEGFRSNQSAADIRDAAAGDVAALVRLRLASGLPIFS